MIVRAEAFLRKIRRAFGRGQLLKILLNLSGPKGQSCKPGLVMIQIDGLGFAQLTRALENGNIPFLSRLLKKEGYINYRHYSGLPSNTPAVQGALFYGVKGCVPAFSYKDHRSGKIFNLFNPESASAVEERLKEKGEALLEGGSAYGDIFTGGAKEAHFCAASMGWGGLLKAANLFGAPLTILLNLNIFIRALALMVVEFFLALVDSLRGFFSGENLLKEIGFVPFRVVVCVVLREIITAGAKIDISRGLPVIHLNFAGFDEQAHHRGPTSAFAYWSLRGIDSAIKGIWKAAHGSDKRDYDVFIYSDHGQEDVVPYSVEQGRSIEDAVNTVFKEKILSGAWQTQYSRDIPNWRAGLLRNTPNKKMHTAALLPDSKANNAVVTAMGPVGYIYPPTPLSREEKEVFAAELVASANIPITLIPDGNGKAMAWNTEGKFRLPDEGDKVLPEDHPFFKEAVRDLVQICHHADAGEIIILGWKKGRKSITFTHEQGSHAGPGPSETSAFALLPPDAVPRLTQEKIFTSEIREAAFRALERANDKALLGKDNSTRHPLSLRIMTYNVHSCMGRDGKISPNRIARIIARHNPDIVALQELNIHKDSHQAEEIAQKLAMTFQFHSSLAMKKGQYGNAVFSRFPIRAVRTGALPRLGKRAILEPRGALWVEIDCSGQKVQVFNTHLSLSSVEGLRQVKALMGPDWIGNPVCQNPVLFCGDFNATPKSKICKHVENVLKSAQLQLGGHRLLKTLPSFYPMGSVDHIFTSEDIEVKKIEVPKTMLEKMASDHLPLIVEVQLGSIPAFSEPTR